MVLIRGPIIEPCRAGVEVLAEYAGNLHWCSVDRSWAATFHPELTDDTTVHEHFLKLWGQETDRELGRVKP